MVKNLTVLFVTALLAAVCLATGAGAVVAGAEELTTGNTVSLAATDQVSQDGVVYDYLWTVVEVDENGVEIGDDLITSGVLTQEGSETGALNFKTPVVPKGQQKKYKVKAKLTPKKGQEGASLATCVGETSQDIIVDGPEDSVIGDDLIVCEEDADVEVSLDESIQDDGLNLEWSVDDEAPGSRNHPDKGQRHAKIDANTLTTGEHTVKLKLKNKGNSDDTIVEKKIHVIHKPVPKIT